MCVGRSTDPGEMPLLCIQCLPTYPFRGFSRKWLNLGWAPLLIFSPVLHNQPVCTEI